MEYSIMALIASNSIGFVKSVRGEDSWVSVKINGASSSSFKRKKTFVACYDYGRKKISQNAPEKLEPLWEDGYGRNRKTMDLIKSDGGPPRWFCPVACGMPLKDSPVLLYLPVLLKLIRLFNELKGLELALCYMRNLLESLIKIVEESVKIEHNLSPNKPIYLLGESFGGTLALGVAARNPTIDLILILANPVMSISYSNKCSAKRCDVRERLYGNFEYLETTSYERSSLYPLVRFLMGRLLSTHVTIIKLMTPRTP
uniref:Serine aminopeptidase S33 domain-containing protein n=1 Tax=Lactuca sativa TaxID=4236 RepID=A0A9R1V9V1_LACSA|nr:hypothetical protein LSAT_V11C600328470 [Lactuca sativa]